MINRTQTDLKDINIILTTRFIQTQQFFMRDYIMQSVQMQIFYKEVALNFLLKCRDTFYSQIFTGGLE